MSRGSPIVFADLKLDERSGPRYRQLFTAIRDAVLDGRLRPGIKLPPSRELAAQLDVARNTVLTAYEQLVAEGYVIGRVGAGSFISKDVPERLRPSAGKRVQQKPSSKGTVSVRGAWYRDFDPTPPSGRAKIFVPGIPDLESFPIDVWRRLVSRSWRQEGRSLLQAGDWAGSLPLRRAIAAHLGPARGVRCTAEQIMLVSSSRQAVYLAASVLADRKDQVWVEDPGYLDSRASLLAAELTIVAVPVDEHGLCVEDAVLRAPSARLAVVTPSNHYPMGVTMSLARRLQLLEWASQSNAWIVEDDYDGEFRHSGKPITALQGLDTDNRVIYVGSFSKTMFPSLRIAFLVCPVELMEAFSAARRPVDGQLTTGSQDALCEFIEGGFYASHIRQMRSLYGERLALLVELLNRRFGDHLELSGQQAGLHLVAKLPPGVADNTLIASITDPEVRPVPLSRYAIGLLPRGGLVLGYGNTSSANLRRGTTAVADALERSMRQAARA